MAEDKVSIARLEKLHPAIRMDAIEAYKEAVQKTPVGVHPFITETLRSFERSNALYNQPWDKKDNDGDGRIDEADEKVTNAPGGSSLHNYGLALDFVNLINGKMVWKVDKNWMIVVESFKKRGFKWGGEFKSINDPPHLEKTFGFSTKELLKKYKAGEVDCDGYVLLT